MTLNPKLFVSCTIVGLIAICPALAQRQVLLSNTPNTDLIFHTVFAVLDHQGPTPPAKQLTLLDLEGYRRIRIYARAEGMGSPISITLVASDPNTQASFGLLDAFTLNSNGCAWPLLSPIIPDPSLICRTVSSVTKIYDVPGTKLSINFSTIGGSSNLTMAVYGSRQ